MDFMKLKTRITEVIGKYKYVWIVLAVGMALMMLPEKSIAEPKLEQQNTEVREEKSVSDQLEDILGHINGAGRVQVMLTVAQGERTIYQTDSSYTQNENHTESRTETILITDHQRNETGLIHQKNPPIYQGAIVLAQGADDPSVKLAIVKAVGDVTGLGADRISVLKIQ